MPSLEDHEFFALEHHFAIARMVRDTVTKNGLTHEFIAEVLEVKPEDMPAILNGGYEFDLRFLSKLQAYQQSIAAEKAKIKVESEGITFAAYKDSYPILLERIEALVVALEQKENKEPA